MSNKRVYLFREANASMRDLLGGKGANLAEMSNIGLPVPPGFTITTEACMAYYREGGHIPAGLMNDVHAAVKDVEPSPGVRLRTAPLNHPNGATGYRIDYAGKSICYLTDTEHAKGKLDQNILDLIKGADIAIYDSMYTDAEFDARIGWGHSTWQEGARLCAAAGVKTFVVFHHDPDHSDDFMDKVAQEAAAMWPGSVVAREGLVLRP